MNTTKTLYAMFFIILFGLIGAISVAATSSSYESTQVSEQSEADVIIYGTPQCHYCKKARKLLSENNVPFYEYDISINREAYATFTRLQGRGTPLIIIEKNVIKGYDEATIRRLLDIEEPA